VGIRNDWAIMLIGIIGIQGQGKTVSMTAYGMMVAMATQQKLYANYNLYGVDYTKIHDFKELKSINSGIVLLDELWLSMDSRSSQTRVNKAFTGWLQQTRKKDLVVFYTTQLFSQVDYRLRQATEWIVSCSKSNRGIMLTFVNVPTGEVGRRVLLSDPQKFYENYNTYEVVEPITFEDTVGD